MVEAGKNITAAKKAAKKASIHHQDHYVYVFACFGLFLSIQKSFNIHNPSDSLLPVYWYNGKEKPFTSQQVIANENATPTLH